MKSATMTLAFGVGLVALGCAAENGPAPERVGQTNEALVSNTPAAAQAIVDGIFLAILRNDMSTVTTYVDALGSCANMRADIRQMAQQYAAGKLVVDNLGVEQDIFTYNVRAIKYGVTTVDGSAVPPLPSDAQSCYWVSPNQNTYVHYFVSMPASPGGNYQSYIDPASAQLTQNLSATKGASAAATDMASGAATTAWQWPTSFSTGGSFLGGEACASLAQSAGYLTSGAIQKTGTYSKCVCPIGGGC